MIAKAHSARILFGSSDGLPRDRRSLVIKITTVTSVINLYIYSKSLISTFIYELALPGINFVTRKTKKKIPVSLIVKVKLLSLLNSLSYFYYSLIGVDFWPTLFIKMLFKSYAYESNSSFSSITM